MTSRAKYQIAIVVTGLLCAIFADLTATLWWLAGFVAGMAVYNRTAAALPPPPEPLTVRVRLYVEHQGIVFDQMLPANDKEGVQVLLQMEKPGGDARAGFPGSPPSVN